MESEVKNITIENFIPNYPHQNDKNYVYDITRLKEFHDFELEPTEDKPTEKGTLLNDQQIISRYFSPYTNYSKGLIFHAMGTGKTCTVSAIIEHFKMISRNDVNVNFKPALVLVHNDQMIRNYRDEIRQTCTKDQYIAKLRKSEIKKGIMKLNEGTIERRIKDAIKASYELKTYVYVKHLRKMPDSFIIREFSGRTIIIDESHRFKKRKETKKGKEEEKVEEEPILPEEEDEEGGKEEEVDELMYDDLWRLFHLVGDKSRLLLMTGTPIKDQASEIASQLNLLLPEDQQLPIGKKFDDEFFDKSGKLTKEGEAILRSKMKGIVSYLRSMVSTAKRFEEGVKGVWTEHVTVYPDAMSDFQAQKAREARELEEKQEVNRKGKKTVRKTKGGAVYKTAIDAATFIYPDGTYGKDAFRKYCVKEETKMVSKKNPLTQQMEKQATKVKSYRITDNTFRDYIKNNLAKLSSKFASIINHIVNHPNEVIYIWTQSVKNAGSILLGLCLQILGYDWIKNPKDIIKADKKKRRFVVMSSNPQTTYDTIKTKEILDIMNKPDNKYGDHLQIIIGSVKISEGISIKTARQVHIISPPWNIPSEEQAIFRVFRFGSLEMFPENERYIKVYRHIAVEAGNLEKGKGFPSSAGFSDYETIDAYIYKIAENKEFRNTQIYRLLKEESFDCALNYKRNVLETDIDGTRDCDYQDCNYQCDGFKPQKKGKVWKYNIPESDIITENYNLLYSSKAQNMIKNNIINLFRNYFKLHINTAMELLDINMNNKFIFLSALDNIINNRIPIRNRYGFISYLKEQNNILFLDSDISSVSSYMENTYNEFPLITEYTPLEELIDIMDMESDKNKLKKFCKHPNKDILDQITYKSKIFLYESLYLSKDTSSNYIIAFDLLNEEFGSRLYEMDDGIIVHKLYSEEYKGISYAISAKELKVDGKMRFYDPQNPQNGWNYITDTSLEEQYIKRIKKINKETKDVYLKNNPYGIYGNISKKDKAFRIITDKSDKYCHSYHEDELIGMFLNNLKILPDYNLELKSISRKKLINMVQSTTQFSKFKNQIQFDDYADDDLRSLYTLLTMKIPELCESLKEKFEELEILHIY